MKIAQELPVYTIGKDPLVAPGDLPTPGDKAAALEAMLTRELTEGPDGFVYRQLGARLQRLKERKDLDDRATEARLQELQEIAAEAESWNPGYAGRAFDQDTTEPSFLKAAVEELAKTDNGSWPATVQSARANHPR